MAQEFAWNRQGGAGAAPAERGGPAERFQQQGNTIPKSIAGFDADIGGGLDPPPTLRAVQALRQALPGKPSDHASADELVLPDRPGCRPASSTVSPPEARRPGEQDGGKMRSTSLCRILGGPP